MVHSTDPYSSPSRPNILIIDDTPGNIHQITGMLERLYQVFFATGGEQGLELAGRHPIDLALLDVMMPQMDGYEVCRRLKEDAATRDIPVLFMSALRETTDKVKGFEAGGVDFLSKPVEREELLARIDAHLTIRRQRQDLERRNAELRRLNRELELEMDRRRRAEATLEVTDARLSALSEQEARRWGVQAFIGQSPLLLTLLDDIRRLQRADRTNVLVLGESGTGKELVARALHFGSGRAKGPFVPVNCSAIPQDLADSLFFGHRKGAFTGALDNRKGWFEQADGGTLFLDELGDMPLSLQAKLLRVLEDGEITPVGASAGRHVDVRVVGATNAELEPAVDHGDFRRDFYFRLAGYLLRLPPLRERRDDVPLLVAHFLELFREEMGLAAAGISAEARDALATYDFPGNIRELKNLVEFALISSGGEIQREHLHFLAATRVLPVTPPPMAAVSDEKRILEHLGSHGRISNGECQSLLGVTHQRASYLLKKLCKEQRIVREGERRWAIYRLP